MSRSTDFEMQLGINRVEVQTGFVQVHIGPLGLDANSARLGILKGLADAGVSHKYLKLTQNGLALVVAQDKAEVLDNVLGPFGVEFDLRCSRSLVMVYAMSLREEEGLVANVLRTVLAATNEVDHVGEMHDKVFVVVPDAVAEEVAGQIRKEYGVAP